MRILIYGGSFNPPHRGHVRAVQTAVSSLQPDRVVLIPAAVPPHKHLAEGTPAPEHRLKMTQLACEEIPSAQVLELELHRQGPSYTADTLRELHARWPEDELIFLTGTDMFCTLESWYHPREILRYATVAVLAREENTEKKIAEQAQYLEENLGARVVILPGKPIVVSSTDIRSLLPRREGVEYLTEPVYAYILSHRLYGARANLSWLRMEAQKYLKPSRVEHVLQTEKMARQLALRWGQDPDDASEAALLHDCTKKCSREEQLNLCRKYDMIPDEWEKANADLLHAKTGAALAADVFGSPEPVASAICWHTTGRSAMTTLEQILYLADLIERSRQPFPCLDEIRRTAFEDLDQAMELASRRTLRYLQDLGKTIHPDTIRTHDYFCKKLEEKGVAPLEWAGSAE